MGYACDGRPTAPPKDLGAFGPKGDFENLDEKGSVDFGGSAETNAALGKYGGLRSARNINGETSGPTSVQLPKGPGPDELPSGGMKGRGGQD